MKQALHIFRKDLAHLWPQTTIVLLLVAAYAVLAARMESPYTFDQRRMLAGMLEVLVPAAYAWLIVTLVHQEALPGDRQFWVTRPYRLGSLLAAKTLFLVLFVSTSMVAKDCYIASAQGFPVLPGITGLLLRLLAWTAWVVLPALAAGVVTRNLQEVGLLAAGLGLVYALAGLLARRSFEIGWVRDAAGILLLAIACTAIVLWQYFRRETGPARAAVACCSVLMIVGVLLLPWYALFELQMLVRRPGIDVTKAQIKPDLARPRPAAPAREPSRQPLTTIALPVRTAGFPAGATLDTDGARIAILSGGRTVWRTDWQPDRDRGKIERFRSVMFSLDSGVYRSLQNQPVTVRVSLALTLLADRSSVSVPAHARRFHFEGSRCEQRHAELFTLPRMIWCLAAFKDMPQTMVALDTPHGAESFWLGGSYSNAPYPAPLDMSPIGHANLSIGPFDDLPRRGLTEAWERPDARLILTPMRTVAHFRRDLEFPGVRLADYVLHVRAELRAFSYTP